MKTSKKLSNNKRTKPPRSVAYSNTFKKDWEKLSRSGKYDMSNLKEVMMLLIANDDPLPVEWNDHQLHGKFSGYRECHIGGDFLLIYAIFPDKEHIIFSGTGTHSELFG